MGQPVIHFEIGCKHKDTIAGFYTNLFGWQTTDTGMASLIDTGSERGIGGHITAMGHEPDHYVLVYIEVPDIAATLEQAQALGGATLVPPISLPDGRTFAWLRDPDGNTVGIITAPPITAL